LALSNAEIELIDFPHYIVKSVLIRSGLFLKLIFVESQHWHHKFVDVLKTDIEGIRLILEVEINNLIDMKVT